MSGTGLFTVAAGAAWLDTLVAEMAGLTVDGQDGRFPDATTDISKEWRC